MSTATSNPVAANPAERFQAGLERLGRLREFTGPAEEFWTLFLEATTLLAGARCGILFRRTASDPVQRVCTWPPEPLVHPGLPAFLRAAPEVARVASQREAALAPLDGAGPGPLPYALAVRWDLPDQNAQLITVHHLEAALETQAAAALRHLRLVSDVPRLYQLRRQAAEAQVTLAHLAAVTDLVAQLNAHERFPALAMTLVNDLASRHQCTRVALGWRQGPYIRLQALSHTDRFERKMEAVRRLEQAMEEAMDQNDVVLWPAPENDPRITRDHAAYAAEQKTAHLCSVPLRLDGRVVGVLTLERASGPFNEEEQRLLLLTSELVVRRLAERYEADRWFGARWATATRRRLQRWLGPEHTWAKVAALAGTIGLAVLCFGGMDYRVEAPFQLRTEDVAVLTAPFAGYIAEVPREVGDVVQAGEPLLRLDTRDLLLEEAAALADLDRALREAEKARAREALADMRVAEAQARQARARLDLVRHRLALATLTSPFDGVVVEGDLKQHLGAPVKPGDPLFKIARTDRFYVECRVRETDIHEVQSQAPGQIAFLSRPKLKFPVRVERIEPVAQTHDGQNVFLVRCVPEGPVPDWWRPGMTGVAKIHVGRRSFLWILTHRTVDFLRMFFWI
ncbi:MAG: HlyD family efflux transporter periplasmic adaptor subunit [Limisphaera sp.]